MEGYESGEKMSVVVEKWRFLVVEKWWSSLRDNERENGR